MKKKSYGQNTASSALRRRRFGRGRVGPDNAHLMGRRSSCRGRGDDGEIQQPLEILLREPVVHDVCHAMRDEDERALGKRGVVLYFRMLVFDDNHNHRRSISFEFLYSLGVSAQTVIFLV